MKIYFHFIIYQKRMCDFALVWCHITRKMPCQSIVHQLNLDANQNTSRRNKMDDLLSVIFYLNSSRRTITCSIHNIITLVKFYQCHMIRMKTITNLSSSINTITCFLTSGDLSLHQLKMLFIYVVMHCGT